MRRTLLALGILPALAGSIAPTLAASPAIAQTGGGVTLTADAVGETVGDGTVTVTVEATDPAGWQDLTEVAVELRLHGRPLERLVIEPALAAVAVAGVGASRQAGSEGRIQGAYFDVDTSQVVIDAEDQTLRLRMPIRFRADPSPGSDLTVTARSAASGPLEPVALRTIDERRTGVSVGTAIAAGAGALLVGAILASAISARRHGRKRRGPSVYAAVARRVAERQPGDGSGDGGPR